MSTEEERPFGGVAELRDSPWQSEVGRPLLIAIQMTCLIAGPLAVIIGITGNARFHAIGGLAFVAALAGVYGSQWLTQPTQRATRKTAFTLAELAALIVALRVATWALSGSWPTLATARGWLLDPISFLDGYFLTAMLLSALAWHRAGIVAELFSQLALTPGELAVLGERRMSWRLRASHSSDRAQISREEMVSSYISQWLLGGFLVVFCAGATRVSIDQEAGLHLFETGVPDQLMVAVVMYFLTGLALISQARLAQMRALWHFDGVEAPASLPGRWNRLSLAIIVAVGLAASLLPMGSTWQAGAIVQVMVNVIVQIAVGIVGLLVALFSWILLLFGTPPSELPQLPVATRPAPPPPQAPPDIMLPPWLGGAAIWLLVLFVLFVALRFLVGPEGLEVTRRRMAALSRRVAGLLSRWWTGAQAAARGLAAVALRGGQHSAPRSGDARPPWRFVRLNALSPRDRVRYFYLSTLRRAGKQGTARQASQTPSEYVHDLERSWPEAEMDVVALTEAFIRARYAAAEVSPEDAREARSVWERVKQALRYKHTHAQGGSDELH